MKKRFIILCGLLLVMSGCNKPETILFLGNSATYYNDMPDIIQQISKQHDKKLLVESFTESGWTLNDHYSSDKVNSLINSNSWDYIVLQGKLIEIVMNGNSKNDYYSTLAKFDSLIPEETTIILFETTGYKYGFPAEGLDSYHGTQDKANFITQNATMMHKHLIAPVGSGWAYAYDNFENFELWIDDNKHPTKEASVLSAYIIFHTLYPDTPMKALQFSDVSSEKVRMIIEIVQTF